MFKEKLLLGQYYPVDSPVHRLHPGCKIGAMLLYTAALFAAKQWAAWGVLLLVCLAAVALSRVPLGSLWRGMRVVAVFCGVAVLLNLLLNRTEPSWHWGFLRVSQAAVFTGAVMGLRLLLLVAFASLLTLTTRPIQLTDSMEGLLRPLERFRVPAHEVAMMVAIALRFIPTLLDEFNRISLAQQARGADLGKGNLLRRASSLLSLLVPLFLSAFHRAEALAQAMDAKCYRGGEGRTRWKACPWRKRDTAVLIFFGLLFLALLLWRILG